MTDNELTWQMLTLTQMQKDMIRLFMQMEEPERGKAINKVINNDYMGELYSPSTLQAALVKLYWYTDGWGYWSKIYAKYSAKNKFDI